MLTNIAAPPMIGNTDKEYDEEPSTMSQMEMEYIMANSISASSFLHIIHDSITFSLMTFGH